MNYKLIKDSITNEINIVKLSNSDGTNSFIPFDEENTDYQKYLEWVAEGNTPEAAD